MQQPLELILTRQWASLLAFPVWVMDENGMLIFYNEPAEILLELGSDSERVISSKELAKIFNHTAEDGSPLPAESLPINIALNQRRPSHLKMRLQSLDGVWRWIETTAFPIIGQGGRHLGAVSIFWEIHNDKP